MTTKPATNAVSTMSTDIIAYRLCEDLDRQATGHPILSLYTEKFVTPILGPTAVAVLRTIARTATPTGTWHWTPATDFAAIHGLRGIGKNSTLMRTINRLITFDYAICPSQQDNTLALEVPTHIPPVPQRHRKSWPAELHRAHDAALAAHTSTPNPA